MAAALRYHIRRSASECRCTWDLRSLRSLTRVPRPITGEVQSPSFIRSRSKSTNTSQKSSSQRPTSDPQEKPSKSRSNVSKFFLGALVVGAASMGAHQAGFIDLQFKDIKLPLSVKNQNDIKMTEDLKAPSEEKIEQKQVASEPNIAIALETDKNLQGDGVRTQGVPTDREQSIPADEKKKDTLDTKSVPQEHGSDTKLPSQDAPAVEIQPPVLDDKVTEEATHEERTSKTDGMVPPVHSGPTTVGPQHDPLAFSDEPKDSTGADAVEHKSLAETYLLQHEHDVTKDESAKDTKVDKVVHEKTSGDGKIVLDIIEAIHAAEKKQADADAYMFSEEKRKLKEKYEKELKDTRARELMYAEEAAILDKELKKEKMKHDAAVKELHEKAEQKLRDELRMKEEETSQQIEKVQELAKAELAAAVAKEKASQLEQIAEANLNIDALCMAFYARSEEARQSHSVHKLALGTLALEQALSSGSPIRSEVGLLRKSLEGIDKDSLLELALSSVPEDVLDYGSDTRMALKQKRICVPELSLWKRIFLFLLRGWWKMGGWSLLEFLSTIVDGEHRSKSWRSWGAAPVDGLTGDAFVLFFGISFYFDSSQSCCAIGLLQFSGVIGVFVVYGGRRRGSSVKTASKKPRDRFVFPIFFTVVCVSWQFNSLKETIRHFSIIPAGGGGILTHAVARVASSLKIKEDTSGDGIESLINRVESLIVDGDLSTAADTLEVGLHGSEAEEIATEWVKQARKRAVAEQTLRLLHACASSTTFS